MLIGVELYYILSSIYSIPTSIFSNPNLDSLFFQILADRLVNNADKLVNETNTNVSAS
jgi:hypothetical protein